MSKVDKTKVDKTEKLLLDALVRLSSGGSTRTDGALTQANVALEAGLSRATFNRYPKVVDSWRKSKTKLGNNTPVPVTLQNKNRHLNESISTLRSELADAKRKYQFELAAARQEIAILNIALQQRDETINNLRKGKQTSPTKSNVVSIAK